MRGECWVLGGRGGGGARRGGRGGGEEEKGEGVRVATLTYLSLGEEASSHICYRGCGCGCGCVFLLAS